MERVRWGIYASVLALAVLPLGCDSADEGDSGDDNSSGTAGSGAAVAGSSGAGKGGTGKGGSAGAGKGGAGGTAGGNSDAGGVNTNGGSSGAGTGGATPGGAAGQSGGGSGGDGGAEAGGAGASAGTGAAGAGGDSGASGSAGAGGTGNPTSDGCGSPAPITAAEQRTISAGGQERGYYLVPPTDYDSSRGYPVVFGFHGSGGTGEGLRGFLGLEAASGGQAIFVYPDGLGGIWDLGNSGADVVMLDEIVTSLTATFCVDEGAIFATGFSYGGWMATQAACARPEVFAGIASIAGGGPQGGGGCSAPVAAMIIHGNTDEAEPIAAGQGSRDHFVDTNGCESSSAPTDPSPCVAYAGCDRAKSVWWCEHDGGHGVPEFAPAGMWSFFSGL